MRGNGRTRIPWVSVVGLCAACIAGALLTKEPVLSEAPRAADSKFETSSPDTGKPATVSDSAGNSDVIDYVRQVLPLLLLPLGGLALLLCLRRSRNGLRTQPARLLKIREVQSCGARSRLAVIEFGGRVLLVGIGDGGVRLLASASEHKETSDA